MPKLAMAMNEGTVADWVVADGQLVKKGEPLMVVETEKVAYDLESPESGYLYIIVEPGNTVPVETVIAKFAANEEELASLRGGTLDGKPTTAALIEAAAPLAAPTAVALQSSPVTPTGGRILASPLARKLAQQHGLELVRIQGSGPGGRIVKRDVLRAVAEPRAARAESIGPLTVKAKVALRGMRGAVAKATVSSLHTAAQVSQMSEIDCSKLKAMRAAYLAREDELGGRVSLLAFFVKALACAARAVPIANASIVGEEIVIWEEINVGIAVALPGETQWDSGLIVPVLRNADQKGLLQLDAEIKDLVQRARSGQLKATETQGGTITLSSTAGLTPPEVGAVSTPVLNMPQAVIVQPANIVDKPVVRDGQIVIRPMLAFSLTFDHRILDGAPFTQFYSKLHACIENPELMLA
ncbi:2-oxo acid dehydrogenase subunit E2 [Pseudomonas sp. CrR25]|nr:2-oxo acid dehydrogenase subunit E2 [Pseudomonas sp. CrR25]